MKHSFLILMLAAFALVAGCQHMGTAGAVLAFTDAGKRTGEIVNDYCTADQAERELFRARLAASTGENKITVECASDADGKTGTRNTGAQ